MRQLLNAGNQPICSRFLPSVDATEVAHPLVLGQCLRCGLVQLVGNMPAAELIPVHSWIAYHESDEHLDQFVDQIVQLPGLTNASVFCGLSVNDDPLVATLHQRGYSNSWRLDLERDLGVTTARAGIETLQDCLSPERAQVIAASRGHPDAVVVRHSLEHAQDPARFVAALRTLVRPEGLIIVEVPDCQRPLHEGDAGALWEEHVVYFTPSTLRRSLVGLGMGLLDFQIYPHELEDSLVCIVRADGKVGSEQLEVHDDVSAELRTADTFVERLGHERERWRTLLADYRRAGRAVALFGAGHRSCTLINLLDLAEFLAFVVDDDPNKVGLHMPGSRLAIAPSSALLIEGISVCLLSLSPKGQRRVMERNQDFLARGGVFLPLAASTSA